MFQDIVNEIPDINDQILENKIKVIPLRKNSKIPSVSEYYNANFTVSDLNGYDGNFGVIAGANHDDSSFAIINIDGYKINKDESSQEEMEEIKLKTSTFIFDCLKDIPNAMHVRTQSGGYHIYLWNKTVSDHIHDTSNNLYFPEDYEIKDLAGKSLAHSIEIFTKEGSKQCVLPGSTILDEDTGEIRKYSVISDINCLSDIGVVEDIHETVKDAMVSKGFTYKETTLSNNFIWDNVSDDGLKELSDDEIKKVSSILSSILKKIDGAKHEGSLCFGGYFSKNITYKSAERICDAIIDEIGDIFKDSASFKKTVLQNYDRDRDDKKGLPALMDIVKTRDNQFNTGKFFFEINKLCKEEFKHSILINKINTNMRKYLSINYTDNTISKYTWNRNEEGGIYYTDVQDILNIAPKDIFESYNLLDKNSSPQTCLTFYRKGMPNEQVIQGDDIESLEKQLNRYSGVVLKPRACKGVLNEIISEYIKLGQLKITEDIPIEGIFNDPNTGKLCRLDDNGNTEIIQPSINQVKEALDIWRKLKEVYPGDSTKLSHILRYGLLSPFSYILKTEHSWLPMLYLYGPSRTSKTTLAEIALSPYTTITDEEISIGGGSFDTPYRIGKALSRQGIGVIINEPSPKIEDGEPREIIKRAVESKYSREKYDNNQHIKIPTYCNMIFTANTFIPTNDAFVRRSQYLEFTKKDRLGKKDIKKFKSIFHHNNWESTDFLKLRPIGDFIVRYVSENPDVLNLEHSKIIDTMLDALFDYANEDKEAWDWLYQETDLMTIESTDKEVINQFRRMVLKDYRQTNKLLYIETSEGSDDEEEQYAKLFKTGMIEAIKKNQIYYLHYQKLKSGEYIIVNTSVKDALNEFCNLQITCKSLADYLDCKYKSITYNKKTIKGFKMSYKKFKTIIDVSN